MTGRVAALALLLPLVACGRPTVTVEVTTTDASGAVVPLPGATVEIWSSDGLAWLKTDDGGLAIFERLEEISSCPPSLSCDWPESSEYSIQVQPSVPGAVCPKVARSPLDFGGDPHRIEIRVPPIGIVEVEQEDYETSIRGAGWIGHNKINADAVAICVWAEEPFAVSLVGGAWASFYTWSGLSVGRGERLSLAR